MPAILDIFLLVHAQAAEGSVVDFIHLKMEFMTLYVAVVVTVSPGGGATGSL